MYVSDFESLSYDEATRAYYITVENITVALQFADGNLYSMIRNYNGEKIEMIFTKYGRTVIEK